MEFNNNEFKDCNLSVKNLLLYKLRDFMLFRGVLSGVIIFLSIPIFLLIKINNGSIHIAIIVAMFPIAMSYISFLVIKRGYEKYSECFHHKYFARYRFIGGTLYALQFFIFTGYAAYISLSLDMLNFFVLCVGAICLVVFMFIHRIKRKVRLNFGSIYQEISGKPFILSEKYNNIATQLSNVDKAIYTVYLALALLTGSLLRASGDMHWGTVGLGMGVAFFLIIGLQLSYVPAFYQLFLLQPRIERKFASPLLSDFYNFLEVDRELSDKILGPSPKRRPMRYEEIFPQDS